MSIYSRVFRIVSCDAFTKFFYEEGGLDLGEEEQLPLDNFAETMARQRECSQRTETKVVCSGETQLFEYYISSPHGVTFSRSTSRR